MVGGAPSSASGERERIAVIGGGLGSLAAVFELTSDPALRARYDITVYQQGGRLGGKGASGRNRVRNDRIEEHGLHVFMGFYLNTFRLLRECYEDLASAGVAPLRHRRVEEAFTTPHDIVLMEQLEDGWRPWQNR